jgi:hypothetical protein
MAVRTAGQLRPVNSMIYITPILLLMQTDNLLAPFVQLRKALFARVIVPYRKSDELRRNPNQDFIGAGSIRHTTWDCKYHVVFIPKCRRKTLYRGRRRHLREVFHRLAAQKESKIEEGHLSPITYT